MYVPTIIDIEASGLGRGSYPIEIGYITSSNETGCTLIKPPGPWTEWQLEAEKLHGISRALLRDQGKSVERVANWLNAQFKNTTVYSDGWVNDMCWVGVLFNEAEVYQSFKIESLLTLLSEEEKEHWTDIHDKTITEEALTRHRASTDAKIIQKTYIKVKQLEL